VGKLFYTSRDEWQHFLKKEIGKVVVILILAERIPSRLRKAGREFAASPEVALHAPFCRQSIASAFISNGPRH